MQHFFAFNLFSRLINCSIILHYFVIDINFFNFINMKLNLQQKIFNTRYIIELKTQTRIKKFKIFVVEVFNFFYLITKVINKFFF